ncbi:MAG: hypothetical protein IJA26_03820, partial [Clostridia bacterium]|nr:hypothetical protein [Clostridia bacterium]
FTAVYDIISTVVGRKYIVLSAPGKRHGGDEKVTDLFLRAYAEKPPADQSIFAQIFQRYACIRDQLCPSFDLEAEFERIYEILHSSRDYAASRGEYLCAKLFSACFDIPFADAGDMLFFGNDGAIDRERSFRSIRDILSGCECAVIPGFYASSPHGIKTFPRGGSDVSGAWIAAALHADLYENWTDVDGVFSADPAKFPDAVCHRHISMHQMRLMAASGANVLHPDALLPLSGTGIDTVIRNTYRPHVQGTIVSESFGEYVPAVTGACPVYFDKKGLKSPIPVCTSRAQAEAAGVISVFGADKTVFRALAAKYKNIHVIHMPHHIQIITEIHRYQTTLADIHRILLKNMPK